MAQNIARGERPHVVLYGAVNSGKSTLFNSLLGESHSVVSELPGTTTDAVYKAVELPNIGPIILVDTPGIADESPLGHQRMEMARKALRMADIILYLAPIDEAELKALKKDYPLATTVPIFSKNSDEVIQKLAEVLGNKAVPERTLTGSLVKEDDLVLLVMPQDEAAPKGRIIAPQVQLIRELLDKKCRVMCVQPTQLQSAFASLRELPSLVVTDSQVFREVEQDCPSAVPLTSFSILMSAYKGSLLELLEGAKALSTLRPNAHILIAEACSHVPTNEDIGRVKLPRLLRQKLGEELKIDIANGKDFPTDLSSYDLVIHCGACMFGPTYLRHRQLQALLQQVPMTNYGIAIAELLGILPRVALPEYPDVSADSGTTSL